MLVQFLGGRAAEELVFDTVTTGASNDIERATQVARAMVTQYGMSKKFGLMGLESIENKYLDGRAVLNCSDVTAADIDGEVKEMLDEAHKEALRLLSENREALDQIAAFLIKKETITGAEFMKIFHEIKNGQKADGEAENAEDAGAEAQDSQPAEGRQSESAPSENSDAEVSSCETESRGAEPTEVK